MAEAAAAVRLVTSVTSLIDLEAKVAAVLHNFTYKTNNVSASIRGLSTRLHLLKSTLGLIK